MEKTERKVITHTERTVHTYVELWHTSRILLFHGQSRPEGSHQQFMGSLVFTAFSLEAYLNHVGEKVFAEAVWKGVERLNPRDKLNAVASHMGIGIDYGKRPWSIMRDLFKFRNDIAHGKSIELEDKIIMPLSEHELIHPLSWDDRVKTDWEKFCTAPNAQRAREDVEAIMLIVLEKRGVLTEHPDFGGPQVITSSLVAEG